MPLVCKETFSVLFQKAYLSSMKKIPKRVGAKTQTCFTPLPVRKGLHFAPIKQTVMCMFSWKEEIRRTAANWADN